MSKPTGGAAFPQPIHHPDLDVYAGSGMTLRDYFAAKAMQGAIISNNREFDDMGDSDIAEYSYALADAMLAARVKP